MCTNVCLHVCMCTVCVPRTQDQKRVSEAQELELQMFVHHHVDTGTQTWVPSEISKCLTY